MLIPDYIDRPAFDEWLAERPDEIRALAATYPPDELYRLSGGHGNYCTVCGYNEDGTVTVDITGEWEIVSFAREVFGVDPATMAAVDLPPDDRRCGVAMGDYETETWIAHNRAVIQAERGAPH